MQKVIMGSEATSSSRDLSFDEMLSDECSSEDLESDEEPNLLCISCSQEFPFIQMYRCKSCTSDSTTAQTHGKGEYQVKIHYCNICIVCHLRRKHEIVDFKGYEPEICENHKNICQYHCETCGSVFCADCTKTHSSHVFQLIEEKAVEVRPKVFEYMTTNEMLAKPLKHKQAITEKCLKEVSELRKSLGDSEINETLRKVFNRVSSSSPTKWNGNWKDTLGKDETQNSNTVKVLESLTTASDEIDKQLKELLRMSDGNLVKRFIDSEDKIACSVAQEQETLTSFTYLQWTNSLDFLIAKCVQEALNSVEIPRIENMEITDIELGLTENLPKAEREVDCREMKVTAERDELFWDYTDEIFGSNFSNDKCSFYLIKNEENISSIHTVVLTNATKVKYIFFKVGYVAVCSTSGSVIVYCLRKNAFVYQFQIEPNCIPLSLHSWTDHTFSLLAWFDDVSRLKFTSSVNGELILPEKPTQLGHFLHTNSFVHSENTVTIWNREKNARLDISNLQHGLSSVDNMKLTDWTTLFLFDYRLHLAVMFKLDLGTKSPRKCSLQKVLKTSPFSRGPTKLMTVNCGRLFACSCYDEIYSAEIPS